MSTGFLRVELRGGCLSPLVATMTTSSASAEANLGAATRAEISIFLAVLETISTSSAVAARVRARDARVPKAIKATKVEACKGSKGDKGDKG